MSFFYHLLSCFIFAISVNLDSLAVGFSYGHTNITIKIKDHLLISLITAIGTLLSMLLGNFAVKLTSPNCMNKLGSILLILLGLWMLYGYIKDTKKCQNSCNIDCSMPPTPPHNTNSNQISLKECIFLACALSLNNCALGLSASLTGVHPFITTLFTFIFSIIFFASGYYLGEKIATTKIGCLCNLCSSLLLIALGIFEFIV